MRLTSYVTLTHALRTAFKVAAVVALAAHAQDGGAKRLRYLALGDSFTCGTGSSPDLAFPAQLRRVLHKRGVEVRVENVAVNGYSTRELVERELEALPRFKPDVVTLAIGANDLVRGDDPVAYRKNLRRIFKAITQADVHLVLVLPQPDWSQSPVAAGFGEPAALRARIEAYNAILREEAEAAGAKYLDLFPQFVEEAKRGWLAPDGLHPSPRAYAAWAEALAPAFAP